MSHAKHAPARAPEPEPEPPAGATLQLSGDQLVALVAAQLLSGWFTGHDDYRPGLAAKAAALAREVVAAAGPGGRESKE
jgi:hypothetical protein